jgi:chromosome partitioning protein
VSQERNLSVERPSEGEALPCIVAPMATTITVLSQKGGTGKTTTTRTLVDIFRRIGLRVLAVDMDPQGNLTDYFAVGDALEPTLADVLAERAEAADSIHSDVLPASIHLAESELLLSGKIGREMVLRRALAKVADDYDLILIDCPPSLGLLTVNALVAGDYALISTEAEYFSLQGVEQALEVVEAARGLSPDLGWLGAVLNIADMRTVHAREALEQLRDGYGDKIFDTPIRRSVAYAESAERAVSIIDHRPDLGADYLSLADEVLSRLGRDADRKALAKVRRELAPAA